MIFGITHDNEGHTIQRLSVSTKVAVGLAPDPKKGRRAPQKLDHFLFLKKSNTGAGLTATWEPDPVLTEHYGPVPREIDIILLSDDIEEVFPSKLAWWSATKCLCWGNGQVATRRTDDHPEGEEWMPCGRECPDLQRADCKPSGDLRFMLADFPQLGAIARIHTTSYRSVMQIHSALQQVQTITGGRLAGIRARLVVRQEKTSYQGKDGARHSTIVPILSLEIKADGIQKLIGGMVETARLFEQTRKLLGGHVMKIEDDEEQKLAGELGPEFYHQDDGEKREEAKSRKERERGTLEPSREPNRGHGNENLSGSGKALKRTPKKQEVSPKQNDDWENLSSQPPSASAEPDMDALCENCDPIPHPRSVHDGETGTGPCTECGDCVGFSTEPRPPRFDTVMADIGDNPDKPRMAELPRVEGKMIALKEANDQGQPLRTQSGAQFVILKLHGLSDDDRKDPHSKFFCYHASLLNALQIGLDERITFVYSKATKPDKSGEKKVFQAIHDIEKIGSQVIERGIRKTIGQNPLSQETEFAAEDENQDAT